MALLEADVGKPAFNFLRTVPHTIADEWFDLKEGKREEWGKKKGFTYVRPWRGSSII
jgi:hypothetical protein